MTTAARTFHLPTTVLATGTTLYQGTRLKGVFTFIDALRPFAFDAAVAHRHALWEPAAPKGRSQGRAHVRQFTLAKPALLIDARTAEVWGRLCDYAGYDPKRPDATAMEAALKRLKAAGWRTETEVVLVPPDALLDFVAVFEPHAPTVLLDLNDL